MNSWSFYLRLVRTSIFFSRIPPFLLRSVPGTQIRISEFWIHQFQVQPWKHHCRHIKNHLRMNWIFPKRDFVRFVLGTESDTKNYLFQRRTPLTTRANWTISLFKCRKSTKKCYWWGSSIGSRNHQIFRENSITTVSVESTNTQITFNDRAKHST